MSNFQLYNILYLNLTFELLICLNILLLIKICYSITFPANFIEYHHLLLTFSNCGIVWKMKFMYLVDS